MNGWFPFEREFIDHPFFDNPKLAKLWLWCKARACFKPQQVTIDRTVIPLEIGQFLFGRRTASERLKIPETTLRDYLKLLESAGFIAIKTTHSYSIITLTYKPVGTSSPPGFPPSDGQQMDTYKNAKNENNESIPPTKRSIQIRSATTGSSPVEKGINQIHW
jgi:hypothetical protein